MPSHARHARPAFSNARRVLMAASVASALGAVAPGLQAQAFPAKAVRIVVPYTAGGPTDLMARAIAKEMAAITGQPVVVENRSGAGGTIGSATVARSAPDGYTLVVTGTYAHLLNPTLMPKSAGYVPEDLAAIGVFASSPMVLVTAHSLNVKTVAELVELARRPGNRLTYSSAGNASNPHLATELFKALAGVDLEHIPYKGVSATVPDLVSGRVPVAFASPSLADPLIKDNRVTPLAVTSLKRRAGMEHLPTLQEAGIKDYLFESSYVMMAPVRTPPEILQRLNQLLAQSLSNSETQKSLQGLGLETVNQTLPQAEQYLSEQKKIWDAVLKKIDLRLE
ncbi:MAG: Bug family tripartite tricarboxylate transporter substrate binding protein [Betaproteobacteria bacterium]